MRVESIDLWLRGYQEVRGGRRWGKAIGEYKCYICGHESNSN